MVGGKIAHVAVAGQPADERRDVQIPNAAAVLRGVGDGALVGQHQLAPVAGDMVIDAGGDGVQQRAFARVAAADDDGYAASDGHPAHAADLALVLRRRAEGDGVRQRRVRALGAGQNAAVGDEGAAVARFQPRADAALSLGPRKGVLQRACVERIDKTLYGLRQVAAEHLD